MAELEISTLDIPAHVECASERRLVCCIVTGAMATGSCLAQDLFSSGVLAVAAESWPPGWSSLAKPSQRAADLNGDHGT